MKDLIDICIYPKDIKDIKKAQKILESAGVDVEFVEKGGWKYLLHQQETEQDALSTEEDISDLLNKEGVKYTIEFVNFHEE